MPALEVKICKYVMKRGEIYMAFFFVIPLYVIIAIILCLLGGLSILFSKIYLMLVGIGTILGGIVGFCTFLLSLSAISSVKRIHLLIPGILFLAFGIGGIALFRQFFCLSEKWKTGMTHDNAVFLWSIAATIIISVLFLLFFCIACICQKEVTCLLLSILSCAIIIVPLLTIHSYCEEEYYKNHSISYEQVYKVTEDVETKLYVNENYKAHAIYLSGEYDVVRKVLPKEFNAGEIVYGEEYDSDEIEVFNREGIIGEVPARYLEPLYE